MVAAPTPIPVSTPVAVAILAFEGSVLLHVPPAELVKVVVVPTQGLVKPVMAAGTGLTLRVIPLVVVQPCALVAVTLYILLPDADGVIAGVAQAVHDKPVAPDIPDHANVDPADVAENDVVLFWQTVADVEGEIERDGSAFTVTILYALQPGNAYVITEVPKRAPVTTPPEEIVAIVVLLLAQVPPDIELLNVEVKPLHILPLPDIGVGPRLMVTAVVYVATHPDELVKVKE
jgi:hypothetical protein